MPASTLPSLPVQSVQHDEKMQRVQINTDMNAIQRIGLDDPANQEAHVEANASSGDIEVMADHEKGKVVAAILDDGRRGQQLDPGPSWSLLPNDS